MWRGTLTPRKAAVLALRLPAGAQTWLSCGFDNGWTLAEHRLTSVFDAINVGNWQRGGDARAKKPTPVPRPSDAQREAEYNDVRAQAFLERQRRLQQPPEEV